MSKSQVQLTLPNGETKVVRQYQFPVKFQPSTLDVNGSEVRAAKTSGKGRDYTYFELDGISYYVEGHLDAEAKYSVQFPDGYVAKDLKPQRVVSNKPRKEKAPKAAKADSVAESDETAENPDVDETAETAETSGWPTANKRRAKRSAEAQA